MLVSYFEGCGDGGILTFNSEDDYWVYINACDALDVGSAYPGGADGTMIKLDQVYGKPVPANVIEALNATLGNEDTDPDDFDEEAIQTALEAVEECFIGEGDEEYDRYNEERG